MSAARRIVTAKYSNLAAIAHANFSPLELMSRRINPSDVYVMKEDYVQAIGDYTQAVKLNPGSIDVYVGRGDAYAFSANFSLARSDWEKALELDPDNADALKGLENYDRQGIEGWRSPFRASAVMVGMQAYPA
jgi:tetratricopeptide (TPR) repeat protein